MNFKAASQSVDVNQFSLRANDSYIKLGKKQTVSVMKDNLVLISFNCIAFD